MNILKNGILSGASDGFLISQKKLVIGDFLAVKNFNEYKRLKLKFAWDKEAEQKNQQDREVYGMAYDDYKGMVDNLLNEDTSIVRM